MSWRRDRLDDPFLSSLFRLADSPYNTNSKSARSLKYPPHSRALQFVERINANFFTTHQLSKLLLISKRFPKELDTIEMNNILKFQQNSWTTNRHHIKFKFSFKLGLGFSWLMQRVGPLPPQQHMAEKHQQITAKSILGKTKVERVDFALPHNLTLPIFYLCCPLLESTKPYSS